MEGRDPKLERVVDSVRGPVHRFLRSILADPDQVEDVAQETFCALIQRYRARFRPRSWTAYALRVAWTAAVRKRRTTSRLVSSPPERAAPDPRRIEEIREVVELALSRLDADDRALLHLRYEQGLGVREISRILGWPGGTVKSRLYHARARLRHQLERLGVERVELVLMVIWPLFPSPAEAAALHRAAVAGARGLMTPWRAAALLVLAVGVVLTARGGWSPGPDSGIEVAEEQDETEASPRRKVTGSSDPSDATGPPDMPSADPRRHDLAPRLAVEVRTLDERPVGGAPVALYGPEASVQRGRTDASGRFTFTVAEEATALEGAWVEVAASGFARQWRSVGLAETPKGAVPRMTLWLPRPARVTGTVREALSRRVVAGAEVAVWSSIAVAMPVVHGAPLAEDPVGPRILARVETDASGRFVLEQMPVAVAGVEPVPVLDVVNGVASKTYHGGIVVRAPGRATAWYALPVPEREGAEVDLSLEMESSGVVRGRVVDGAGRPVQGVCVRAHVDGLSDIGLDALTELAPGGSPWVATTDDAGAFEVTDIPCSPARARRVMVRLDEDLRTAVDPVSVMVVPDGPVSCPDIVVSPRLRPRSVAGRVVDGRGRAVADARVSWIDGRNDVTRTDASGRFDMRLVGRASRSLRIRWPGRVAVVVEPHEIEGGIEDGELLVEMGEPAAIRGTVRDETGRGREGLSVLAVPARLVDVDELAPPMTAARPELVSARATTGPDGAFRIDGMTNEAHHLLVARPATRRDGIMAPWLAPTLAWRHAGVIPGGESVTVTVSGLDDEVLGARDVAVSDAETGARILRRLVGRLMDADGHVVAAAVFDGPGRLRFLDIPCGSYDLVVAAAGYTTVRRAGFEVGPASERAAEVALRRGVPVAGRLVAPHGWSVAGATVTASSSESPVRRETTRVAADGTFRFESLGAGRWHLVAAAGPGPGRPLLRSTPKWLDVAARDTGEVALAMEATEPGHIVLAGLPPRGGGRARLLSMAELAIRDATGRTWMRARADAVRPDADDEGRRRLRVDLPVGEYEVVVTLGGKVATASLVVPDEPAEVLVPEFPLFQNR